MLSDADVRAMVKLVGDVADNSGSTLVERKRQLAAGVCELTRATAWMWVVSAIPEDNAPAIYSRIYDGLSKEFAASIAAMVHEPEPDPVVAVAMSCTRPNRPVTVARQDYVDDAAFWRHPAVRKHFTECRLDQSLYTFVPKRELGVIQGLAMHRIGDRRPFTSREKFILHHVMMALPFFHTLGVGNESPSQLVRLTRRERMFVDLLMDDLSTRELADCVGISPHTVNDYTKAIYRQIGVNSRAELVALFAQNVDLSAAEGSTADPHREGPTSRRGVLAPPDVLLQRMRSGRIISPAENSLRSITRDRTPSSR
jgi:DNA-binding CsgD family transcriptional regulator